MDAWELESKRILKAELVRRDIGYKVLSARLAAIGVEVSAGNLSNKINRGKFSFAFFLQCMKAANVETVRIDAD